MRAIFVYRELLDTVLFDKFGLCLADFDNLVYDSNRSFCDDKMNLAPTGFEPMYAGPKPAILGH